MNGKRFLSESLLVRRTIIFFGNSWIRACLLTLYYLAIITGLIILYGKGDFSTPEFIYQGF
jgi:hypothetical protein